METARRLEYDEPTTDQLEGLTDNKIDAGDIHNIHSAQLEVRDLIDGSDQFFTERDKERFNSKWEQIKKGGGNTDIKKVLKFKKEIEDQLAWVKDKKPAYERKLRAKKDFFQDGAIDEYIEKFNKASIDGDDIASEEREKAGKMERWDKLEAEIREQTRTYKEFIAIFGDNKELLRTLGKSDRQEKIDEYNKCRKNIEACKTLIEKNAELFSDEEKEEIMDEIEDSISENQRDLLRDLKKKIEIRKNASEIFNKLPQEYKDMCGDFAQLSAEKKQQALEKVENRMKDDYRKKQKQHKNSKSISDTSKEKAAEYFDNLPIDKKIEALGLLDGQFEMEAPLTVSFDDLLEPLIKVESADRIKKRRKGFLDSNFDKKLEILKDLKEESEITDEYFEQLQVLIDDREIPKRSGDRARKKWGKASLETRRSANTNFKENFRTKKEENVRFRDLIKQFPPNVQAKHEDYWDLNYYERVKRNDLLELRLIEPSNDNAKKDNSTNETYTNLTKLESKKSEPRDEENDEIDKIETKAKTKKMMSKQKIKDKRRNMTTLRTISEETKGSQRRNQEKTDAQDKDSNIADKDKKIAKALKKYSKKHVLNKDGEAEEIVYTKVTKMETMTEHENAELRRKAKEDIIESPDQNNYDDKFQLLDDEGKTARAEKGLEKADEMEDEIKEEIIDEIFPKLPDTDEDSKEKIEAIIDEEDMEVDLKLAA